MASFTGFLIFIFAAICSAARQAAGGGRRFKAGLGPVCLLLTLVWPSPALADMPSWLPRYDLDVELNVAQHCVTVCERVTWTNHDSRPSSNLVFNAHAHFAVPKDQLALNAKTLEILRLAPSDAIDLNGPPLQVESVCLLNESGADHAGPGRPATRVALPYFFRAENDTALEIGLPHEVRQGERVTVEMRFSVRLPQREGRWGQWEGVTFLVQWLPVLAFYDQQGWQPTPFVPWHLPFFNEAGIYTARIVLPVAEKLACSGTVLSETVLSEKEMGGGWKRVEVSALGVRDFAVLSSARFREITSQIGPVRVHSFAFPEHEFYSRQMLRILAEALPVFERWFGPLPYPDFTIVESYFGWNGNQCGDLVMIDARIYGMPHRAANFVDQLVSHEFCHQWWYNVVGVNGYAETWMDEGLAVYFSHHLQDCKYGKNNTLVTLPGALEWLPNIHRDDYRYTTMIGSLARGEAMPTVQDMPKFKNLVRLMAITYDRGGKIVGMIADRLGEDGFFDFMRIVYAKYQYRILRVADFQRELEAYTGRSWQTFFDEWLYGKGMTDWSVDKVQLEEWSGSSGQWQARSWLPHHVDRDLLAAVTGEPVCNTGRCRVTVMLRQKAEYTEQTVVGFSLDGSPNYQVRIPILPDVALLELQDPPARVEMLPGHCVRMVVELPCEPTQVTVDPDAVLLDRNPTNNNWKPRVRLRLTPLYTQLEEVDLTNACDRWNIIFGPWVYDSTYNDPWYTRSAMAGLRLGAYRTQEFSCGAYVAYRSDDRNIVAGVDALWNHVLVPQGQIGLNIEQNLTAWNDQDHERASRGVLFERYVMLPGSSLYLAPFEYIEAFEAIQSNPLPDPSTPTPGTLPFHQQTLTGLHYHLNLLTPYWNPETGVALDTSYAEGLPILGEQRSLQEFYAQASAVKTFRDMLGLSDETPLLRWFGDSRLAARVYAAEALQDEAQVFTLGGGDMFRGYSLGQRQGSTVWLASVEWRIPLIQRVDWDVLDHVAGIRNIYGAPFYDVGDAYVAGKETGPVAHAVGVGLRIDVAWCSMVERTILRFDVAKTVDDNTPAQFWFGLDHPF